MTDVSRAVATFGNGLVEFLRTCFAALGNFSDMPIDCRLVHLLIHVRDEQRRRPSPWA
jgi:hypothetical protein